MTARPTTPCPICEAPSRAPYRPFCSCRCADVDLGRWLTGQYVAPGALPDEHDDQPEE